MQDLYKIMGRLHKEADLCHYTNDKWIDDEKYTTILTNILLYEALNELRSIRHLLEVMRRDK